MARAVLDAQPFSRLLGTRLTEVSSDRVILELDIDDRLRQQYGLVHGGVLSYLADNALTYAAALALGTDVLTNGFTIDYVGAAREGASLRATATLVHSGRRKATSRCEIEVVDDAGATRLCAVALGTALSTAKAS